MFSQGYNLTSERQFVLEEGVAMIQRWMVWDLMSASHSHMLWIQTSLGLKESLSVEPDSVLILVHCDSHIEFKAHLDFPSC